MSARWLHRLAHWTGWNGGRVVTWWSTYPGRYLMVGFRCDGCGEVSGIHEVNMDRLVEKCAAEHRASGEAR